MNTPITNITVGAMQSRFSVMEEVTIKTGKDEIAKVFVSRLGNSKYANLLDEELQYGVGYIVNYLEGIGKLHNNVTSKIRLEQLFKDGTRKEAYTGKL